MKYTGVDFCRWTEPFVDFWCGIHLIREWKQWFTRSAILILCLDHLTIGTNTFFKIRWYHFVDADLNGYLAVWSGDITRQNKHLADHTMKRKQLRSQSS